MPKKREKRAWHPAFLEYMKFIVAHPNYADMPNKFKANGEINWVSPSDQKRAAWWDKQVKELGLVNRAEVARAIHPKELEGLKPCQICGRELSIFYVYPNKVTLKKLNTSIPGQEFKPYQKTIDEIFKQLLSLRGKDAYGILRVVFNTSKDVADKDLLSYIKDRRSGLSPGAMSNPPDRLDGFHTYNACCRSKQDTGRFSANLVRYTQDRRAYENWADGNWNLSNRLMGEYQRYAPLMHCPSCGKLRKMTPDHIGPISLGFTHRPKFNPLCDSCNSRKNNRITLADVRQLISEEKKGEKIISWHSQYIWDLLKNDVSNDSDALLLSKLMRTNLHHVLTMLSMISEAGFNDFLKLFLHPEFSFYDYKFVNFNPTAGPEKILTKELSSLNKKKNAERYIRISFESLDDYKEKDNRNQLKWKNSDVDKLMEDILICLKKDDDAGARTMLRKALRQLALDAQQKFTTLRSA
jgi:Alw26I/Eco31I/Esp3I family type II restriction endonuclease